MDEAGSGRPSDAQTTSNMPCVSTVAATMPGDLAQHVREGRQIVAVEHQKPLHIEQLVVVAPLVVEQRLQVRVQAHGVEHVADGG